MRTSKICVHRFVVGVLTLAAFVRVASADEILIVDAKSQPESLTIVPGGLLFAGSASTQPTPVAGAAPARRHTALRGFDLASRAQKLRWDLPSMTVIKEGLKTPTAVEPAGDVIWVAERGAGKAVSIPMPK